MNRIQNLLAGRSASDAVRSLLEEKSGMFVSAVLTDRSRALLLRRVPPAHANVFAHHVTMAFDPDPVVLARYQQMEGRRLRIPVVAVAVDDKAQAVLVGAESENEHPHITISTAEGVKPVYSNELFEHADQYHVPIFTVEAVVVIEPLEPPNESLQSVDSDARPR